MTILILLAIIWIIIGISGFIYWWTSEHDLTAIVFIFSIFAGLTGPIAWIFGYFIHGDREDKILIKKRKK